MSLIPSRYLDTVVAIGYRQLDSSIRYTASGFVYGFEADQKDKGHKQYFSFIVTNRHVLKGSSVLFTRQNYPSVPNYPSGANLVGDAPTEKWTAHPDPDIDVAVFPTQVPGLDTGPVSFYNDTDTMLRGELIRTEFREGDEVFVLGFPLAMVGGDKNYVIARQGIIARIQDWYDGAAKSYLIDSSIFPGNSGGPVLAKPTLHTYGTAITRAKLIGMVSAYVPFQDVARSDQTGLPMLASQENSGLAVVVPVDAIEETIAEALAKHMGKQEATIPKKRSDSTHDHHDRGRRWNAVLLWLKGLCWEAAHGSHITFDARKSERNDYGQMVGGSQ